MPLWPSRVTVLLLHTGQHTHRPVLPAHECKAFGVVNQARKVDQAGCSHDKSSSREHASYSRFRSCIGGSQPGLPVLASPLRNSIRTRFKWLMNAPHTVLFTILLTGQPFRLSFTLRPMLPLKVISGGQHGSACTHSFSERRSIKE